MQYQLEALRDAGVLDAAIVVGPNGNAIRTQFGTGENLGMRLVYFDDPCPSGIASSLLLVEPWIRGPFALFLGDIMFTFHDLSVAFAKMSEGAAGTLAVRPDTADAIRRNFAVIADGDGRVSRVIEKPADPPNELKGCGVYSFDAAIFEAIRRTPRSPLRNEYEITDSIQTLIDMGRPVFAVNTVEWDENVTYAHDLLTTNLRLLQRSGLGSLIGAGASVHRDATVRRSIIGHGAIIDAPVVLDECLVWPGAVIREPAAAVFRRHIFAEGLIWSADGPQHGV